MEQLPIEVDLKKLAEELGVEIADLQPLFMEYCNEMEGEMQALEKYGREENWDMLQRTAHNVKGVSINLGLMGMHKQAEILDRMMKENLVDGVHGEIEKMTRIYKGFEKAIQAAFEAYGL